MAYYFGINVGAGVTDGVTEGSSTTSKDVTMIMQGILYQEQAPYA